jgi:thiamine-monophosphate kinase
LALAVAEWRLPHAMIDLSDGLSVDLAHVTEASGCGAEVDAKLLAAAVHGDAVQLATQSGAPAIEHALHDGEDFELLMAFDSSVTDAQAARFGLLPLGRFVEGAGVWLADSQGQRTTIDPRGWEHFR